MGLTAGRGLGLLVVAVAATVAMLGSSAAVAVTPPNGYRDRAVVRDLERPVGMEVAPDGRLFVVHGRPRRIDVVADDVLVGTFLEVPGAIDAGSGLLGLAFAPDFAASGDVYITYVTDPAVVPGPQAFRLSRWSSDGVVADPDSEVVLFEVPDIAETQMHQGGDVDFGPDGMLYWTLGDRSEPSPRSQSFETMFGKVLRLRPDGTIPEDNPWYDELEGDLRAVFAIGFRNPYRMERHPVSGELYVSEVGPDDWEELDLLVPGGDYGWPTVSGPANDPRFVDPVHAYPHDPDGCAITGGSFYVTADPQFPSHVHGDFLFGDFCFGWLAHLDMTTGEVTRFATGGTRIVEVKVSPTNGAVYYLDRELDGDTQGFRGGIGRIDHVGDGTPLTITQQPADATASIGEEAVFEVAVDGDAPLRYQWWRDGVALPGATSRRLVVTAAAEDDGVTHHVVVTDGHDATVTSDGGVLTVLDNHAPEPSIELPVVGTTYVAGRTYDLAGSATDVEDGTLGPETLTWSVEFHHGTHTHDVRPDVTGVDRDTFTVPVTGETETNVWYRVTLSATDSTGASRSTSRDLHPELATITLDATQRAAELRLDGQPVTVPHTFVGVAGMTRTLWAAPSTDDPVEDFSAWSDGGAREHTISTPTTDTTFLATYAPRPADEAPVTTLTSPPADATVGRAVVVTGTARDDHGLDGVQLVIQRPGTRDYFDGTAFQPGWRFVTPELDPSGGDGDTVPWRWSGTLPLGDVAMRARAVDDAGNRGAYVRRSLTVAASDPGPPIVELTTPGDGDQVEAPVVVGGTAVDDVRVDRVLLKVREVPSGRHWNGSSWQGAWTRIALDVADDGGWSFVLAPPEPTRVVVTARAFDDEGASSDTPPVRFEIVPEHEPVPPELHVTTPGDGDVVTAPVTFRGTVRDDVGVRSVRVVVKRKGATEYWDGSGWGSRFVRLPAAVAEDGSWSLPFDPGSDEWVVVRVRATDVEGARTDSGRLLVHVLEPAPGMGVR